MKNLQLTHNSLGFEIIRELTNQNTSLQSTYSSCITIGYVVSGAKNIYFNGKQTTIVANNLFILGIGTHYEEDIVSEDGTFEQISFQIAPQRLQQVLFSLSVNFGISLPAKSKYSSIFDSRFSVIPADEQLHNLFASINNVSQYTDTIKRIKLNELIYLLATSGNDTIKEMLLRYSDSKTARFIATIHENIFENITLQALAAKTNCSLTTFKKNFNLIFGASPRRWIIKQRLDRSKFLLQSIEQTISEIAYKCGFANVSHFIKLFKLHFGGTPKEFRRQGPFCE